MPINVRVAGAWPTISAAYVKQAGVWLPVQQGLVKQAGIWIETYAAVVVATISANVTNLNISTLFSAEDWESSSKKKLVVINYGVIVGSTSVATAAILTGIGRGGALEIINNGEIQGAGGAANSGVGGPAINVQQSGLTLTNNGAVRGGGGGGGHGGIGGSGGGGYYNYTIREPSSGEYYDVGSYYYRDTIGSPWCWAGEYFGWNADSISYGGYTYYKGSLRGSQGSGETVYNVYGIYRTYSATSYTSGGAGGAGGNGGAGRGYAQSSSGGSGGSPGGGGGANAGSGGYGGAGGAGGGWASAGAAGNSGSSGNAGNNGGGYAGSGGSGGGAAGAAIIGASLTLSNPGTINGATP